MLEIAFSQEQPPAQGVRVVGVFQGLQWTPAAQELEDQSSGALSAVLASSRFAGGHKELLFVHLTQGGQALGVLLVGLGEPESAAARSVAASEDLGGQIAARLEEEGIRKATLVADSFVQEQEQQEKTAVALATGLALRSYRFDRYHKREDNKSQPRLTQVVVQCAQAPDAAKRFKAQVQPVVEGVHLARDYVSEPANVLFPASFVARARSLERLGVKVTALGPEELTQMKAGAILGVAQGSVREPYLLVMEWKGAEKDPPVILAGKGVCFDSGGISIKPATNMESMKYDMAGAGAVIGAMAALAGRKAQAHVVGICGLVENMPSGTAQRPGDVVTSLSGQTIEIINTDAEGRLVLADVVSYAQQTYNPRVIIDLATLTGAVVIALGHEYSGLFSNDDQLARQLTSAGEASGESCWRLPLAAAYDKLLKSDIADMKNVGSRAGGAITAAQFIGRFIQPGVAWAHLDIAAVAWADQARATCPKGARGFGVRLLDRWLHDHYG